MAKYGADTVTVNFDNSGGSPVDMSQHVLTISGINIQNELEESHTFGDAWVEHLDAKLKRMDDITITGFYDDAATTGPDVIFNSLGSTRTLQVVYGSTKSTSVECVIQAYRRLPARGELTKYEVVLRPTGAVTEA